MKRYSAVIACYGISILLLISCSENTIELEGLGAVRGKVVAKGTNEPLENVKIATNPSSSVVFTDAEGNYVIENIPAGDYSISAEREGLLSQFEGISILTDKEVEIVFEMDVETANNKPPEVPILEMPSDNSSNLNVEVMVSWTGNDPDDDDLIYTLTIRNNRNSDVQTFENITESTFLVTGLKYATKYFWQVSSNDGINAPVNSTTYAFETGNPPNNRILFTRLINDNNVIYSSDEQGNSELKLSSETKNSFRPRRSINNKKIAFLQSVGSQIHLFTMNEDGSEIEQVTSQVPVTGNNLEELNFSWSDNGATLLYPNQDKLYRINIDGSGLTLLYQTNNGHLISEVDANSNTNTIALKTNNLDRYETEIFTINTAGIILNTVVSGVSGAVSGIHLSFDGTKLLYSRDISGFENNAYRQLDTRLFIYDFTNDITTDISLEKPAGTNDLDARFSPNEASVIFVNTSNDGISLKKIQRIPILDVLDTMNRTDVLLNAFMPDWK